MNKPFLFGVSTANRGFLQDFFRVIHEKNISVKDNIGVEYTRYHYDSLPRTQQDFFWKGVIDSLKRKGFKEIVFLDDHKTRMQIDAVHEKGRPLTEKEAELVFEREKIFKQRFSDCRAGILGAAHALNLKQDLKANVYLDSISFLMHSKNLIPLNAIDLLDKRKSLARYFVVQDILSGKIRLQKGFVKVTKIKTKKKSTKKKFKRRRKPAKTILNQRRKPK